MSETFRGLPACSCLAAWLPAFETAIGRSPRWFQLVGDAPASAGFHKGGGSADSEPLSDSELRIARNMGAAAWNRWWTDSDGDPNYHAHLRLSGCPHNAIAQPQVADLNAGRDGTGPLYDNAGAPDNGPRDGVLWPLRTWREGIKWAEALQEETVTPEDIDQIVTKTVAALKPVIKAAVAANKIDVGGDRKVADDTVARAILRRLDAIDAALAQANRKGKG